jgi:hypothetical protein
LSGNVITKVGVMVLDGTENWYSVTNYTGLYGVAATDGTLTQNELVISTHYVGTVNSNANMVSGTAKATHASVLAP